MSRRSRSKDYGHKNSRRFIDDITGQMGYTNNYKVDHHGRMVLPENYDPRPAVEITPIINPEVTPLNARPKAPVVYRALKDSYNFPSSYLDRLKFYPNGIQLGELNPDRVTEQLANLQSWEEIDVIWNSDISQFTNSSWNQNINFVDNILDDVYTFGVRLTNATIRLPGED